MIIKTAIAIIGLVLLAGCSVAPKPAPVNYYLSHPANNITPQAETAPHPFVLKLYEPKTHSLLRQESLLYSPEKNQLESYAYSRWHDSPPTLLHTVLLNDLADSGLFSAVIPATSRAHGEWLLESHLESFHHEIRDGRSYGVLAIRFLLIDAQSRKLLHTHRFHHTAPMQAPDPKSAVTALNQCVEQLSHGLIEWLAKL